MQSIEIFSQTDLERCKAETSRFVSEHEYQKLYVSADYNSYSDVRKLLRSVEILPDTALLLFTDNPALANRLNTSKRILPLMILPNENVDPRLAAKFFKVMPHKVLTSNVSHIWVDANLTLPQRSFSIEELLQTSSIAFFDHDKRVSVYEEYLECLKQNKDSVTNLKNAISLYENHFPNYLLQGRVIIRKSIEKTMTFNEIWWSQILNTSIRDQLTLPYALEKSGITLRRLPAESRSKYVVVNLHKKVAFSHRSKLSNFFASLKNELIKCVYRLR